MRPAPPDTDAVVVVRKVIRATPARLFAAWTEPRHLVQWWGPGPVTCPEAEVDLRVGGRYRIANRMPDGAINWIDGTFEAVEAPHLLVYSWRMGDAPDERVTVRFNPHEAGAEVVVRHERIASPEAVKTHRLGWEGCLNGLAAYLDARHDNSA
ncbi:SRPBCC family protein [Bauldia sp.]|uniref:SRPBCC family protein n=1 Tax=Bauldia sp. TaxID=2575872 RepID=UPI003BA92070